MEPLLLPKLSLRPLRTSLKTNPSFRNTLRLRRPSTFRLLLPSRPPLRPPRLSSLDRPLRRSPRPPNPLSPTNRLRLNKLLRLTTPPFPLPPLPTLPTLLLPPFTTPPRLLPNLRTPDLDPSILVDRRTSTLVDQRRGTRLGRMSSTVVDRVGTMATMILAFRLAKLLSVVSPFSPVPSLSSGY